MKRMLLTFALLSVIAGNAFGQQPLESPRLPEAGLPSPGDQRNPALQSVSPEVWVYMQERERYEDPKQAVRRKAEARAMARTARIEARRWFGFSNARPTAAVTPFTDQYSPAWRGNGYHGYDWAGVGGTTAVIRLDRSRVWR